MWEGRRLLGTLHITAHRRVKRVQFNEHSSRRDTRRLAGTAPTMTTGAEAPSTSSTETTHGRGFYDPTAEGSDTVEKTAA